MGTTAAPSNPSTVPPEGKNYYLGYEVTDGVVSTAYVCFVRNNTEYCLKGYDTEAFATNNTILEEAFGASACYFDEFNDIGDSGCHADGLSAGANSIGHVVALDIDTGECDVASDGHFACGEF